MQLFNQLPKQFIFFRHYKQKVIPSQIALNTENLAAADQLLTIPKTAYTKPRQLVEKNIKEACLPFFSGQISQGLCKLLPNLIGFLPSTSNAEWRKQCFDAAALYWKNTPQHTEPSYVAEKIWQSAPALQTQALTSIQQTLYADLPSNQLLQKVKNTSAIELLYTYNLAQWQGAILALSSIRLTCQVKNSAGAFKVVKQFKQAGLLFELQTSKTGPANHQLELCFDAADQILSSKAGYKNCLKMLPNILLGLNESWELHALLIENRKQFELDIQKSKFNAALGAPQSTPDNNAKVFLKTYQKQLTKIGTATACTKPPTNWLWPDIKIKTPTQEYFIDWQEFLGLRQIEKLKHAVQHAPKNYWFAVPHLFKAKLNSKKTDNIVFFKQKLKLQDLKKIIS